MTLSLERMDLSKLGSFKSIGSSMSSDEVLTLSLLLVSFIEDCIVSGRLFGASMLYTVSPDFDRNFDSSLLLQLLPLATLQAPASRLSVITDYSLLKWYVLVWPVEEISGYSSIFDRAK